MLNAPKLKVIVAEDHGVQRAYMCMLINKLGYETIPAEDGLQALKLICESDAQILISDLNMPNLNGIELTVEIRKLSLDRYVHVIMLTGQDENDIRSKALESGVDDFMPKGMNIAMLTARLRAATRLIHHEKELAERNRILKESNDRIQKDLRSAAIAQRRLLPEIHDDIMGFRVSSAFVPSSFVSGDMFGCFPLSDTKLGFYMVDVSGHGVQASLLSVAIGHLITPEFFGTKAILSDTTIAPAALVTDLNQRFCGFDSDEYFTMFCGIIDKENGHFDYCQAGHPSPYYVTSNGQIQAIGDGGFPVGMLAFADYENHSLTFDPGASLILCSDAAIEAENHANIPFGEDRLQSVAATAPQIGPANIPDQVIDALNNWRSGEPLEDDLTVVAIERI
ncbi:SpoIIE family protein phosphatase [Yoonia maritima]|uniref:SpoIIE family protein phosphatase n=1 Tax=Yoonia maritima TaxID=1435347 RepID=UPI000D0F53E6|nr:SpoIIE family protein phosphatase [Yoonia maritima]